MQDNNLTVKGQDLQQIANILLLNGTLTECPGLVHGKMGIAIFFFHYARYINAMLFADYASDLIGEIQDQLHANSQADYEKGIAGIGIGIDYLIRNDFLDVEEDIFEDFDQRMYRAVMYDPWQDFSLYHGGTGYGKYWVSRLHQQPSSIQAQDCLMKITEQIERNIRDIPSEEQQDVYRFLHDLQDSSDLDISPELLEQYRKPSEDNILKQIPALDRKKSPVGMGLLSGYAGEGLLRLTALDATDRSWTRLL